MIDPEIWRNEKVGSLPDAGRLLFIGIFSQADDDGRLKASPGFLMANIFPYDKNKTEEDIRDLRDECATLGLIRVYTNGKEEYLDIPGWLEHQQIRGDRYKSSSLPSFDKADNQLATNDNQPTTTGKPNIIKSSLVKSKHEVLSNDKTGGKPPVYAQELFDLWNSLSLIKHKKLTGDMTQAMKRATSRGFSAAEISQAMKNYALIVNDEQCYFKYKWTLKDFLNRGLEKFLDLEVALNNYRRGGERHGRTGEHRQDTQRDAYDWQETPEPDDTG